MRTRRPAPTDPPATLPPLVMEMELPYLLANEGEYASLLEEARAVDPLRFAFVGAAPAALVIRCALGHCGLYLAVPPFAAIGEVQHWYRPIWAGESEPNG